MTDAGSARTMASLPARRPSRPRAATARENPPALLSAPLPVGDDEYLSERLDAARSGDEQAFADVYRAVQPRLVRYARVLVGQDAEDVTAEAWLQVARDLRGFSGDADGFRGWTATIVRNRALDQLRARSRRPSIAVDPSDLSAFDDQRSVDAETAAAHRMSTTKALERIATLPPDQAEAVLLRAVVGLDARAAGEVLGKRPGAVRVAAHRGLKRLAEMLADEGRQEGHRE